MTALSGWRRNLAAFSFGAGATLTLPPFFMFPLLINTFGGLYWLLNIPTAGGGGKLRAFADGWWWGWGFHITGLYWFCIALLTDPEKFAWLIPFALFALTAIIAVYSGIACLLWKITARRGVTGVAAFASVWTLVELARGYLFSGFPWNLAGYSFAASDALLQLASLVGIEGLTWCAVFLGALPALLLGKRAGRKKSVAAVAAAYALLLVAWVWGDARLPEEIAYVPGVKLRLVQASIPQNQKWEEGTQIEGVRESARLTQAPGIENVTHVIWPETAVPYVLNEHPSLMRMLGNAVSPGALLITGGLRTEGAGESWRGYNVIAAIDHRGGIVGYYDKNKLVPFGEFLPFRRWLPKALTAPVGERDFSSGPGAQTISWPGLPPMRPLICYEAIFPEYVSAGEDRPQWLLNITNDAWFGVSSGPHQHFHMARMRAVEQGAPLIRVANTGITAVIDGYGRIISQMEMEKIGIIDSGLPAHNGTATYYKIYRNLITPGLILLLFILIISQRRTNNN